jgi:hypothetical protein
MDDRGTDGLDQRMTARLRSFAEEAVVGFDAEQTSERARAPRYSRWASALTVALATSLVVVIVALVGMLGGPSTIGPGAGQSSAVSPVATTSPLTRDQAIAAARAAAPHREAADVISAESGAFGELVDPNLAYLLKEPPPADRLVWVVDLASGPNLGQEGSYVVIDGRDGRTYGVIDYES